MTKEADTKQKSKETATVLDADSIEKAKPTEVATLDEILAALHDPETGEIDSAGGWDAAIVAADYFWPAAKGLAIRGKLLSREERMTNLIIEGEAQSANFYTFELTAPCIAIRSADMKPNEPMPKPVQCSIGTHVSVLERTILRRLEPLVGKEVIVVCDGLGKTKANLKLWKYRAWSREPIAEVPQLKSATIDTDGESVSEGSAEAS